MQELQLPAWPKDSYMVKMFDLVKNAFPSLLALHRQAEINRTKAKSLLWGQQNLADLPRGALSLLFWEVALHIPLLISVHILLKGDLCPFFLLHLKSLLMTKQLGAGQRNLYPRSRDEEKSQITFGCKVGFDSAFH